MDYEMHDHDSLIRLEIAVLYYASIGKIRTNKNQYPYFMKDYNCENVVNSLVKRGFLKLGTVEESIKVYPYKELQAYLSNKGIKPGNKRGITIEKVLHNYEEDEIIAFFGYLCYVPTPSAVPFYNNCSINDFYSQDMQVSEKYLSNERYIAYTQFDTEAKIYIINDDAKIIRGREEKLSKFNDLVHPCQVSLYINGEFAVTYKDISIIYYLKKTKILIFIEEANGQDKHYPYDYSESKELHSFCMDRITVWNVLSYDDFDKKAQDKHQVCDEEYIYYYISSNEIVSLMLSEHFGQQEHRLTVRKVEERVIDEKDNNYIVQVKKKDAEMNEFIIYLFRKQFIKFPTLYGSELNRIFTCFRFNIYRDREGYKYIVDEYNHENEAVYETYNLLRDNNINNMDSFIKKCLEIYPATIIFSGDYKSYTSSKDFYTYDKNYLSSLENENEYEELFKNILIKLCERGLIPVKWIKEFELYKLVKRYYPDTIYQYRDDWLGLQSIDIYIPSISVGIEYQGIQHYEAVDYFGGTEKLETQMLMDKKKKEKCKNNQVALIEWKYTESVNDKNLISLLSSIGIEVK